MGCSLCSVSARVLVAKAARLDQLGDQMKGLALTGIYIASLGLMVTGVETGRINEEWAPALYLIWATAGLVIVAVALLRKDQ